MVQQRAYLRMLVHDLTPIGRRVRDLPDRGDRVHVGHLIRDRAEQRHQEHRDRTGRDERRCGVALHGADLHRQRCDGDDDRQRGRAIQRDGDAVVRRHRVAAFVDRHGDVHRYRADQHEHDDERDEQRGPPGDGAHVDRGSRYHEEDGNEESVADAFQFHFQRLAAVGDDVAQDEARGERAEHRVKVKQRGDGDEEDEQERGQPHQGLR